MITINLSKYIQLTLKLFIKKKILYRKFFLISIKKSMQKSFSEVLDPFHPRPDSVNLRPDLINLRPDPVNLRPFPVNLRPDPVNLRPDPGNFRPDPVNLRPDLINLRSVLQLWRRWNQLRILDGHCLSKYKRKQFPFSHGSFIRWVIRTPYVRLKWNRSLIPSRLFITSAAPTLNM